MPTAKSPTKKIDTLIIAVGGQGKRLEQYFASIGFTACKQLYPIKNKPLLCHIIDLAYNSGLKNIILLAGDNGSEMKKFTRQYYPKKKIGIFKDRIDKNNQKIGLPRELWLWSQKIKNDYIFVDGNIVFKRRIMKKLLAKKNQKTIFSLAANSHDLAPTHSAVIFKADHLKLISARYPGKALTAKEKRLGQTYCSMGLMRISSDFYLALPQPKIKDLDLYTEELFKRQTTKKESLITTIKDNQLWLALHYPEDIDRLAKVD